MYFHLPKNKNKWVLLLGGVKLFFPVQNTKTVISLSNCENILLQLTYRGQFQFCLALLLSCTTYWFNLVVYLYGCEWRGIINLAISTSGSFKQCTLVLADNLLTSKRMILLTTQPIQQIVGHGPDNCLNPVICSA